MSELSLDGHVAQAFSTPIVTYPWPESAALNRDLAALVLSAEGQGVGLVRSNVGGWHSDLFFLARPEPAIEVLRQRIVAMIMALTRTFSPPTKVPRDFSYSFEGWANIIRHGQYAGVHNHPKAVWSGIYYVQPGEADPPSDQNGRLELLDPRPGANMMSSGDSHLRARWLVAPHPGLMVLFPSWLQHMVHPFEGRGARISIAFNVVTTEVERPTGRS
jgi:uncharacterized protein (TIGR02466 family)